MMSNYEEGYVQAMRDVCQTFMTTSGSPQHMVTAAIDFMHHKIDEIAEAV